MTLGTTHAVVMGGSMAGLLAARALSPHFARVTLIERDALHDAETYRKGVPQGRHLHVLLAAGLEALDRLFQGFRAEAITRGATQVDIGDFGALYLRGVLQPKVVTGASSLMLSRTALERCVRDQLKQIPNIQFRTGCSVHGVLGNARAVTGVRVTGETLGVLEDLTADLVIDATGRGSKVPSWLEGLGLPSPKEDVVRSKVSYASCTIARRPEHLGGAPSWVITPTPPLTHFGAALALEGERYVISFTTYVGETGPASYEEMITHARALPYPGLHELLRTAEPLSDVVQMHDAVSRRRRYEKLSRFPDGLLVIGDAMCNFNPAYGQGMSVAALEAELLQRTLQAGTHQLARRFFTNAAKIIDAPWMLATGADFQWEAVEGKRPFGNALINAYVARVIKTAGRDSVVRERLLRVMHLLRAPESLFAPAIARRVLLSRSLAPASFATEARV